MLKIFSKKKAGIFLISFLVFSGLFLHTQPAHAIFGVGDIGLLDVAMMQLDALDFGEGVVLQFIIFILVLGVESQAFLSIAAHLLQWAVNQPVHLSNALVSSGFNFVSGLTNLFFILIFVGIALAFILKTETFGMKKALPNLIIIALLINFSLVFVGMITDIGDIFRNALLSSFGNNFVSLAAEPLNQSAWSVFAWFMAIPIGYLITALIPYANVAGLVIIVSLFLTDVATGGILLKGLFLIILNFVTGGIFFLYFGLFLVRIVIIWILAISAPLALFAYILPATKKYFSQWLHYLISWTFMGIAAIFLIGLGLTLFSRLGGDSLLSWGTDIDTGRGVLPSFVYNYLFLIIYLGVTFFICKKYVPMGADMIMKQGEALIGKTWGSLKGTRTMGEVAENIVGTEKWGERAEKEAQKLEQQGKTGRATFMRWAGRAGRGVSFVTKPIRPALIDYAAGVRKTPLPANWKQMTIDDKVASINASRRDEDKLVQMHAMGEEGTLQKSPQLWNLVDRLQDKFKNDPHYLRERSDVADILTDRITADVKINLEVGKKLQDDMTDKINNWASTLSNEIEMKPVIDKEAARLVNVGLFKTDNEARDNAAKNVAARYIHYTELKSGDIKNQAKESVKSTIAGRAFRDMTPQHLQAIQNNFKTEIINKVMENTFQKMFEGKTDGEARNILDDYYNGISRDPSGVIIATDPTLASKHGRMVHWANNTPAGREMNLPLRQYMTDPNNQPTNNLDVFERKMKIFALKTSPELNDLYKDLEAADVIKEHIAEARGRKEIKLAEQEEGKLNRFQQTIENKENALGPDSRTRWEEIKTLKYPGQKRRPGGGPRQTPGGGPGPSPGPGPGPTPGGGPSPTTPQTPRPSGTPSHWVPGPGGMWVPPSSSPSSGTPPTPPPGPTWPGGTPPRPRSSSSPPPFESLLKEIEKVRQEKQQGTFGIPIMIGQRLQRFLRDNGVTQEEFDKMKPDDAWNKAIEIAERLKI